MEWNYLCTLGFNLIHVSEMGPLVFLSCCLFMTLFFWVPANVLSTNMHYSSRATFVENEKALWLHNPFSASPVCIYQNLIFAAVADDLEPSSITSLAGTVLTLQSNLFLSRSISLCMISYIFVDRITSFKMMTSSNGNGSRVTSSSVLIIHWSPLDSPHKGSVTLALIFSLMLF